MGDDDRRRQRRQHHERRTGEEAVARQRNGGAREVGHKGMAERNGIQIDHEAAAAQQEQPGEGDDERLDLAEVDDQPLAARRTARRRHSIIAADASGCQPNRVEIGHHDADETDHRADRKIDAAGKDDESGADRGDDDERVVGEDVAEHQGGEKIVVEKTSADE